MNKNKNWIYVLLFAIVALGFFLRFVNIDHAPPGVYPDEAVNGIDAVTANNTGNYQLFYTANNGREGLFMNLVAICFKLFGISVMSLRLPAILCGTLVILGTYLLTKELFTGYFSDTRKERLAIIAGYLVAVSYWAINFSRISFRANMLPLVLVFSFYFLFKGLRTKKWWDFALGGLVFGLGLHTYIAFRIAPAILIVMLVSFVLSREHFLKEYWKQILIFIAFTAIAAAPMLYTFYIHPDYLISRTASISVFSPEVNGGHLIPTFLRSLSLSLVKYNFWGDQNWRHNYPPYPILDVISGIAFLFGFIYSLIRLVHLFTMRVFKKERNVKMDLYVFLASWFFIMLSPEFLTNEGLPHALRSIGTLPVVFIFSAITIDYLIEHTKRYSWLFRSISLFLVILLLLFVGLFNSIKYHIFWASKPEVASSFENVLMDVSDYLKTLPAQKEKFVVAESMQRIPIMLFNENLPNLEFVYSGQIEYVTPKTNNFIIILTDKNDDVINYLENKFPNLELKETKDSFGLSYYTLE
ncbi:MAG: glycosyltransferase family 39 protein [Candidatus Moranbacteria bacterium]|nr:glycosyltransferase family 39 protein [Candidatus Moranbacteria bacterium]